MVFIGPTPSSHPGSIGGTTNSFQILLNYVTSKGIDKITISTNRTFGTGALIVNALYVLLRILVAVPTARVVIFNANPRGAIVLAPLVYAYAALWRRPFVFRMFGGDLIEVYAAQSILVKQLLQYSIFKSDLFYLQTNRLVNYFSSTATSVRHLPTAREPHNIRRVHRTYEQRFVFVGKICKAKGMEHVLHFQQQHGESVQIDLYGPIGDEAYRYLEQSASYKGVLKPNQVTRTLANYDVLLLPTFYPGEGYPGVIIEANSVGLPTISTHWLAIPELVLHQQTGLLIEPDNYVDLEQAILGINEKTYQQMSQAALIWSDHFLSTVVCERMLQEIIEISAPGA